MPRRFCACVLCAVAAAVAYLLMFAAPQPASAQQPAKPVSFINDVAPILKENCFACHDAKKKSGKFDMTTFEKLMAGGANGEPIVAGQAGGERVPRADRDDRAAPHAAARQGRGGAEGQGRGRSRSGSRRGRSSTPGSTRRPTS